MNNQTKKVFFGQNLRYLRKKSHLNQEQMAEIFGLSQNAVKVYEKADGYPRVQKLLEICNYFQVSLDEMFYSDLENRTDSQIRDTAYNDIKKMIKEIQQESSKEIYKTVENELVLMKELMANNNLENRIELAKKIEELNILINNLKNH